MGISIDSLQPDPVPLADRQVVEDFVTHEGQLADEFRLEEWEALWAEDAIYWVPIGWEPYDPCEKVSLVYEDRAGIAGRVARLAGTADYAEEPRSRVRRVLGQKQISAVGESEYRCSANFFICAVRRDVPAMWGGTVTHRVRINGNSVELVEKVVWLLNSDSFLGGLGFIL